MYADYHKTAAETFFETFEVGKNMHAVNTAICPEIEQNYTAAEFMHCQGTFGIDPVCICWKLRRTDILRIP
jgi:hypothetical protein